MRRAWSQLHHTMTRRPLWTLGAVLAICILVYIVNSRIAFQTSAPDEAQRSLSMNLDPSVVKIYYSLLNNSSLKQVPPELLQVDKCPACFGRSICAEMLAAELHVPKQPTPQSKKGVYYGTYRASKGEKQQIVLKQLGDKQEFGEFDESICQQVTGSGSCDVSEAVVQARSPAVKQATYLESNLRSIMTFAHHGKPNSLPFALCASAKLIKALADMYGKKNLKPKEQAVFFTSLAINPEAVLLPFFFKEQIWASRFPVYVGTCGRTMVSKHAGIPLENMLDLPFPERADLASQLLKLIAEIMTSSDKWVLVFTDFHFHNFYVSLEGLVYIVDLEDMMVVDQSWWPTVDDNQMGKYDEHAKVCNEDCFNAAVTKVHESTTSTQRHISCVSMANMAAETMYGQLCRHILSDLPEHKADRGEVGRGLLHTIPGDDAEVLEQSLQECVTEKEVGQRQRAVAVLLGLLEGHTMGIRWT